MTVIHYRLLSAEAIYKDDNENSRSKKQTTVDSRLSGMVENAWTRINNYRKYGNYLKFL